ncbi:MAG: hypothetical protein GX442_07050 [Candidatus Riflebacteria bacterium]|nr:hypothetical protein [Candidatus Riflebacteria bacterium]
MNRPFPLANPTGFPFPPARPAQPARQVTTLPPWILRAGAITAITFLLGATTATAQAAPMDWFKSRRANQRSEAMNGKVVVQRQAPAGQPLPDFFASQDQPSGVVTGATLTPLKFAEAHWTAAKENLENATRAIQGRIQEKKCQDLVAKLFVVDSQTYKEILKNSASGLESLGGSARTMAGLLVELNRIITAPQKETLDNLERTLARIQAQNASLLLQVKAHMAGAERLITLAQEAFQTLELIPSLSLPPIDMYVQVSKQVMRQAQSSSEAQKGLLFNVQSGAEQVTATLETMVSTIRTTLRFSDHFAFRQFPLVNLPVPTREKLFAQLGALKNAAKGIQNTLSIGDSHLKNSAQQFTHLAQSAVTKIGDALKYQGSSEYGVDNLPQISGYSYNQVCGLFQRVKDGINEMKMTMAKEGRGGSAPAGSGPMPTVAVETEDQFLARKAKVAGEKLPLFLLGGGAPATAREEPVRKKAGGEDSLGEMQVLYSEREPPAVVKESLMPDEVDILQQELGNLMTGAEPLSPPPQIEEEGVRARRPTPKQPLELIPPTMAEPTDEEGLAQAALPPESGEARSSELLRMEATAAPGETGDLLPMFRLEDFSPPPEKE